MSKIVAKPFNPAQKILRAIFRGSPNLFTTEDVNRQIENFEHRLNDIETRLYSGIVSDAFLVYNAEGILGLNVRTLTLLGTSLLSSSEIVTFNLGVHHQEYRGSIYLWYKTTIVTYESDTSHAISGAKFEDGTSRAAADHLTISAWGIVTQDALEGLPQGVYTIEMISDVTPGTNPAGTRRFALPTFNVVMATASNEDANSRTLQQLNTLKTSFDGFQKSFNLKSYTGVWRTVNNSSTWTNPLRINLTFSENFGILSIYGSIKNITSSQYTLLIKDMANDSTGAVTQQEAFQWLCGAYLLSFKTPDSFDVGAFATPKGIITASCTLGITSSEFKSITFLFSDYGENDGGVEARINVRIPIFKV